MEVKELDKDKWVLFNPEWFTTEPKNEKRDKLKKHSEKLRIKRRVISGSNLNISLFKNSRNRYGFKI